MKISELNSKTYLGAAGAKSKSFVLLNYDDTATDSPTTNKISVENLAKEVAAELGLPKYNSSNRTVDKIVYDTTNSTYKEQGNPIKVGFQYPKMEATGGKTGYFYPLVMNASEGTAGYNIYTDDGGSTIYSGGSGLPIPIYDSDSHTLQIDGTTIELTIPNIVTADANGDVAVNSSIFLDKLVTYDATYDELIYGIHGSVVSVGGGTNLSNAPGNPVVYDSTNNCFKGYDASIDASYLIKPALVPVHVSDTEINACTTLHSVLDSNLANASSFELRPVLTIVDSGNNSIGLVTVNNGEIRSVQAIDILPQGFTVNDTTYNVVVADDQGNLYTVNTGFEAGVTALNT